MKFRLIKTAVTAVALLGAFASPVAMSAAHSEALAAGKALAFNKKKGNCLACHQIAGGSMAGNIAPPLIAMKARYPNKSDLRAQIYDSTVKNPNSMMPPFGRHKALTDKEIDLITDFIYSL